MAWAGKEPWILALFSSSLLTPQESVTFAVTQFLLLASENNHAGTLQCVSR